VPELTDATSMSRDALMAELKKDESTLFGIQWDNPRVVRIQPRGETNEERVADYVAKQNLGAKMPFATGRYSPEQDTIYVTAGIHSSEALYTRGVSPIPIRLRLGSQTEAEIEALKSNADHGAALTSKEADHAIEMALRIPALGIKPNRELARLIGTYPDKIEKIRERLSRDPINPVPRPETRVVTRGGTEFETDASKGSKAISPEAAAAAQARLVKSIVTGLSKRLEKLSDEARAAIYRQLVAAIQAELSLTVRRSRPANLVVLRPVLRDWGNRGDNPVCAGGGR